MRLVLDTNTVVSALLWRGKPHELLFDAVPRHGVALFASPWLLAELLDVLTRGKFAHALSAAGTSAEHLIQHYRNLVSVIHPAPITPTVLNDPDDDHVLACAATAKADYIVSGDRGLIAVQRFENIPIVKAAEAVEIVGRSSPQPTG